MSSNRIKQILKDAAAQRIYLCRSGILQAVEAHIANEEIRKTIRSHVLRCFGERGLEKQFFDDIESILNGGGPYEQN